jgi:hypothetical protein
MSIEDLEWEVWRSPEGELPYELSRSDDGRLPISEADYQVSKSAEHADAWTVFRKWRAEWMSNSMAASSPALPPDSPGLRPDSLPPEPSGLGFTSTLDIETAQGPEDPVSHAAKPRVDRKATGVPEGTSSGVKSPRRCLDPELAKTKQAKLKTGASWRRVAKYTGLSHSYLVQ